MPAAEAGANRPTRGKGGEAEGTERRPHADRQRTKGADHLATETGRHARQQRMPTFDAKVLSVVGRAFGATWCWCWFYWCYG